MENSFLKGKYDLHNAPEVESAAERTEIRTGEKVPQDPTERIQNYLDRFNEILDREDPEKRERGVEAIKKVLYDKFVIKSEAVPESAFLLEQRIAREQGHGTVEITQEFREKKTEEIINNQTRSLDKWVDYLASPDATYPDWAKYWAVRSVLEMGKLQKEDDKNGGEKVRFQKRSADTVASFPPLNPRALAMTIGVLKSKLEEKVKPKIDRQPVENKSVKLNDQEFRNLLSTEDFSKIYGQFLVEMPEYSTEGLQEIRGEWIKYDQGSDGAALVQSLEGHPLEWCTANLDTANTQLQSGDFYIYYSLNEAGEPIIPRVAIRMDGDHIAEVRGIAHDQNVDPYIAPVIDEKMKKFGSEGETYKKKSADMERVTALEDKMKKGRDFTKDDLVFLYEMDASIEGFGYQRDPRIEELRDQRSSKEDMLTLFECTENQIAHFPSEINENTKAYVGAIAGSVRNPETNDMDLDPGDRNIFQKIGHLEHIYTSFPEGRIRKEEVEIGGKNAEELMKEMRDKSINIYGYAEDMMKSKDFTTLEKAESADFVRLKIGDLGFPKNKYPTTDEVYKRIEELGLELCPAETGPHYRIKYADQPLNEWVRIGMKQIAVRDGRPNVFHVERHVAGLWLIGNVANPDVDWNGGGEFMFRLRKLKNLEA
jgi:hypothetical protein